MHNQLPDHYNNVGPGWRRILSRLHYDITYLDNNYEVDQVKEKFGGLRVYLNSEETNLIKNLIANAEWESERTCEECGNPGKLVSINGWWSAICPVCHLRMEES